MPYPELMSTAEVAAALDVDQATVNRWAREGDLPTAHKLPGPTGARLFRRDDVRELRGRLRPTTRITRTKPAA